MPLCWLYTSVDVALPTTIGVNGAASFAFPWGGLPPSFACVAQWVFIDARAYPMGGMSAAWQFEVGVQPCPVAYTARAFDTLDTVGTVLTTGTAPVLRLNY